MMNDYLFAQVEGSPHGVVLATVTAHVAMLAYAASVGWMLWVRKERDDHPRRQAARWLWTAAYGLFLLHVATAFQFVHGWSHRAAWEATARETEEALGVAYGAGVWWNYAFALVWMLDQSWWWWGDARYRARPKIVAALIHGGMLAMVLSATVLFGTSPGRWIWAGVFVLLAIIAWRSRPAIAAETP